jgi:hypothetical protein
MCGSHADVSLVLRKMWVFYLPDDDSDGLSTYPEPYAIPLCSDKATLFLTFDPKDGGTTVPRNDVTYLPVDTANTTKKWTKL